MMNINIEDLSPAQLAAMVQAGLISLGGQTQPQSQPQPQPQPQSSNPDLNLAEQYMERRFGNRFREVENCKSPIERLILNYNLFKDIVGDFRRLAGWDSEKKYPAAEYNIGLRWGMELDNSWVPEEDGKKKGPKTGTRVKLSTAALRKFGIMYNSPYYFIDEVVMTHRKGQDLDEDTKDIIKNGVHRMRKSMTYLLANEGKDGGCLFFAKPQKGKAYDRNPIENCPGVRRRMMDMSVISRPEAPEGVSVGNKLCV